MEGREYSCRHKAVGLSASTPYLHDGNEVVHDLASDLHFQPSL